jgi:hypothetical protein
MKDIQEVINEKRAELENKLIEIRANEKETGRQIDAAWKQKKDATAELEKQLELTREPFDTVIKNLRKTQRESEKLRYNYEWELRNVENSVKAHRAMLTGTFEDAIGFAGYLLNNHIRADRLKMIATRLPNGITLFTKSDELFSAYYAVDGVLIIGFHHTKKSEHPGDQADYHAWIGVEDLKEDNKATETAKGFAGNYERDLRFREWKERISKIDPKTAKAINVRTKANQYVLNSEYRLTYLKE